MRGHIGPRTRLDALEVELQPKLYRAVAARPDDRVARCEVWRLRPVSKRGRVRGVIAVMRAIVCAVRIRDGGSVEHVKHLEAELGAEPLLERERLE